MNKLYSFLLIFLFAVSCKEKSTFVNFETDYGDIVIRLYDQTPIHKANFERLVKEGFYDGVLFHRVINDFMIQTGDPDSKGAPMEQMVGAGGPGYTIPAEFHDSIFHKKGAVAAARDNNPEKASSGSQFYIVEGKKFLPQELKNIESKNNVDFSEEQEKYYQEIGGTPFLDQNYTIFGEVIRGMDVVEKISEVETNHADRPVQNVKILRAKVIKFKE